MIGDFQKISLLNSLVKRGDRYLCDSCQSDVILTYKLSYKTQIEMWGSHHWTLKALTLVLKFKTTKPTKLTILETDLNYAY